MKKTVLIASSKGPIAGHEIEFLESVRDAFESGKVLAGLVTRGPGCINYAFVVEGEEAFIEGFGRGLSMAMMPARWCYTEDPVPDGFTNQL